MSSPSQSRPRLLVRPFRLAAGAAALALVVPWLVRFASPAVAAVHQVTLAHYAFSPTTMTVTAGDTVTWTNSDQASHDVATSSAPAPFHSPLLATGQSWSITLNTPGTYSYYCSVHPDMRAQLVVLARPTTPVAPPSQTHSHANPGQPGLTHGRTAGTPTGPAPTSPAPPGQSAAGGATGVGPSGSGTAVAGPAPTSSHSTLDPLLLVAGVVTAVAVFCLLVLATTPHSTRSG